MPHPLGGRALTLALAVALTSCKDSSAPVAPRAADASPESPSFTLSTSKSTLLGRATFSSDGPSDNIDIRRKTGDWQMDIKAKSAFDVAVQSIVFKPGTSSGWHSHPGPVFIQVVSGTLTFYMSNDPSCAPMQRTAGQAYLDVGEMTHLARNEGTADAQTIVTYFAPPGAALRIDQPQPANCTVS